MKLAPDEFEATLHVAREYLQDGYSADDVAQICRDFAGMIVKIANTCVVGAVCERHGGAPHGQEAEELRAGVEQILENTADVRPEDEKEVFAAMRKSLIFLLDRIDARDSLAFCEATDPNNKDSSSCA